MSTKKTQKTETEDSKADDEDFLAKLVKMCADKTKQFEDRKMVRANEEAAVAEAVSILNNDEAFETFGAVKATTEGGTDGPCCVNASSGSFKAPVFTTNTHRQAQYKVPIVLDDLSERRERLR